MNFTNEERAAAAERVARIAVNAFLAHDAVEAADAELRAARREKLSKAQRARVREAQRAFERAAFRHLDCVALHREALAELNAMA